jgi:hypothetical protein
MNLLKYECIFVSKSNVNAFTRKNILILIEYISNKGVEERIKYHH